MKSLLRMTAVLTLAALTFTSSAFAAVKTVNLEVSGMTCNTCTITVRKALEKVDGVKKVKVDYDSKTATVEFDDSKTSPEKLAEATTNAGYPSKVKEGRK